MLLKLIRNTLGQIIIAIDYLTRPRPLQRPAEDQAEINKITRNMALYQFNACPFCVKTRRTFRRLNLEIETRDAINNLQHRSELAEQGGKIRVPCLKIDENGTSKWMYESDDIIKYLDDRFSVNMSNERILESEH